MRQPKWGLLRSSGGANAARILIGCALGKAVWPNCNCDFIPRESTVDLSSDVFDFALSLDLYQERPCDVSAS